MFGFSGILVALIVAASLGLPLPGAHLAVDALLVTVGFDLTRAVRRSGKQDQWLWHFWLTTAARILVPLFMALGLVALYWTWQGQLDESKVAALLGGASLTLNVLAYSDQATAMAIEHLWLICTIGQFAIVLPVLVAGSRRHFGPERRTAALIGLAAGVAICRLGLLLTATADPDMIAISTITRLDGLLIGAAIGVCPFTTMRRRIPLQFASAAFACLMLVLLLAPSQNDAPVLAIGVLSPAAVALAALVTTASAVGGSQSALANILDIHLLRWLGERALSFYIWHSLFGFSLEDNGFATGQAMQEWPGASVFVVRLVFSLAAAAASQRYLVVPAVAVAEELVHRMTPRQPPPPPDPEPYRPPTRVAPRRPINRGPGGYSSPNVRTLPIHLPTRLSTQLSTATPIPLRSLTSRPPSVFGH
jgi:peptidoglycan/LPS O-acetylase OafA/YrhL